MSNEQIIEFLTSLPAHDRATLLHILEVAEKGLILDCEEKRIFKSLAISLWKSIKMEEL